MSNQLSKCCNAEIREASHPETGKLIYTYCSKCMDNWPDEMTNPTPPTSTVEVSQIARISFYDSTGTLFDEEAQQAITALLLKERKDGMLEGFKMSGEGWNGEYPYGDRNATDEEILADILPKELQAQLEQLGGSKNGK